MKLFGFIDSVLDDDHERLREILRITAKHNRRKIPVSAYFYFGNADPELFDLLEKAGFRYLRVGIESSNPETLRRVGRGERNLSHIDNALPYRDRFEIVPYIISHLPGETPQSFRENIKACFRKGLLELDFHCNRLNIYPGAPLHAAGKKEGYVSDPRPPHHVFSSPGWSYESFVSDREFLRNVMALGKFFKPDDERFLAHNGIDLFEIAENIGNDSPGWKNAFTSISSDTISDVVIQDCMADEFEKYAIKEFKDKSKAAAVSRLFRLRFAERRAAESFGGAEAEYGAAGDIGMDLAVFVPCYYELPPGLDVAQIAASPETKIKELGTLKRNLFIVGSTGRRTYSFEAANGALAREMLDALAANRTEKKPLREILKPMPAERRSAFMSLVAVLAEQGALAVCASYIE